MLPRKCTILMFYDGEVFILYLHIVVTTLPLPEWNQMLKTLNITHLTTYYPTNLFLLSIPLSDKYYMYKTFRWPICNQYTQVTIKAHKPHINFSRSYEYFSEDGGKGFSFLGLKWPHWSAKWPGLSIYTT